MNRLCGIGFTETYSETETALISHKFYGTTKSDVDRLNSVSFKVFDVPGSFIKHKRASDFYFLNVQVVLIVLEMQNGVSESQIEQWTNLALDNVNVHDPRDEDGIPPFICHIFTKYDECLRDQRIQIAERLEEMHKRGAIGHYLFVSSKTEAGMDELKNAIFDSNIDIGPKFIVPSEKMNPIASNK